MFFAIACSLEEAEPGGSGREEWLRGLDGRAERIGRGEQRGLGGKSGGMDGDLIIAR